MKKTLLLTLFLFLGTLSVVHSQECGGTFTDPAGPTVNYANNSDYTVTICPTNPGDVVTVTFTSFDTETTWDALYVFNGNSIAAPQIASSNPAGNGPANIPGGYWGTSIPGPFISTSPDGCLTFRFKSDGSVTRSGWVANVTCAPPLACSSPTALTVSSVTFNSVILNWSQPSNPDSSIATNWEILALPCGSPVPSTASTGVITANTNPFVLTGLVSNTCYDIYIRAICDDLTPWCGFPMVTTAPAPPVCGGQFVDNGGVAANYANNSDNIYTICPTIPGELVTVVFSTFNIEATWDALYVFDGSSLTAPQIASMNAAANVPGGLAGGYWGNTVPGPFTSTSPDGCLTFRFRSDTTVNSAGWVANVTCAPDADKVVLVAFVDQNSNGVKDTGEPLFPNGSFIYQQNSDGINVNGYSPTGQFALYDTNPVNTYAFSYQIQPEYVSYYDSGTTTFNNISIAVASGTQFLYFPITLTNPYNDVTISIAPMTAPRPGLTYSNKITYKNQGVATANGTITFVRPPEITLLTSTQTAIVTNGTGFTYAFTNLLPNETRIFYVTMTVPNVPTVNLGDLLTDSVSISAPANDIDLTNNSNTNSQIVVNSFDPNDKMEARGKNIPFSSFAQDDYFFYTIRFQNNGTANAIDVRIEDLLNSQIDYETVRMVSSSHNYTMKRVNNQLVWDFKNIHLTPSSVNLNGSMGYLQFKVQLNPGFQAGDIIPNNASIFFDSNPAIVTNTFSSKFTVPLSVVGFDANSLVLYPNPAKNIVQIGLINTNEQISKVVFYDVLGKIIKTVSTIATESVTVDISDLAKGVYLVEIGLDNYLKLTKKLIIQ
ncbi:MAG: T9SS type A sorting domain-containing protein [Bacteroidota bacterium]